MIHKLKRRFITLATVSMFVLMTVLVLIMNLVNYSSVVSESDAILDVLSQPNLFFDDIQEQPKAPPKDLENNIPPGMSPEAPYEARYFSVMVSPDGEILESDLSKIISVDEASAKEYIEKAIASDKDRDFIGQFRYVKTMDDRMIRILFLDCGRKLDAFLTFFWISLGVGFFGCLIVFAAFLLGAGKIVRPIAESYEKQKRFISDAGHEIKTPLTVINANLDLLESDYGEVEELSDIRTQTKQLTALTNDLVLLSKMEEQEHHLQKIELPLSDIVSETISAFHAPAAARKIELAASIRPHITVTGSPDKLRQLITLLLDNAVKYSPDGGMISLSLEPTKKSVRLSLLNTTRQPVSQNDLPHLFDRFYRADTSRNSETGGHGIGLSIAKAIVDAHGGTITASTKGGEDFTVTVVLPL